jgi:CheY-like chemotaxis protein
VGMKSAMQRLEEGGHRLILGNVPTESPLIAVIDDSEDIRETFQLTLEGAGYRVVVAADGRQGLEVVRAHRPDLIITDISMPEMNGFEFLVHLRSDFSPPLPPVIVCSGFDVTAAEALRLGASRFVAKPVDAPSLIMIVEQTLGGQPASEAALAHERAFVQAARARGAAAAERLFAVLEAKDPRLEWIHPLFAQRVADYFGFAFAGILFVDHGNIRVGAVSRGSFVPAGMTLSGNMLFSTGVLAGGASLVITDAASFFGPTVGADPRVVALGLQFLVAVPLLFEDVPIGTIALFDRVTHPFHAEDLLVLERIGHSASESLRGLGGLSQGVGFVTQSLFDEMLGAELSILHRDKGGLELLLVQVEPAAIDSKLAQEVFSRGGSRFVLCQREAGMLALFKRDLDAAAARNAISEVLSMLCATGAVRAAGSVALVDAGMPRVSHDVALRLADSALAQSRMTANGRVERMVLGGEAWADGAPAASP